MNDDLDRHPVELIYARGHDGTGVNDDLDHLADRLDEIGEELADLAMAALRRAIDEGEEGRPAAERRITRARRSVEKAASLLRGADGRSPDPDD